MSVAFVRQLGYQPGIQLNPIIDNSDGFAPDNSDQVFAIAMRCVRGRIDRPFLVDRSNVLAKIGRPGPIRANALNEATVHVYEALFKGAQRSVIQRLTLSGAPVSQTINLRIAAGVSSVALGSGLQAGDILAITHHECFNDGVIVEFHTDLLKNTSGAAVDNSLIWVRLRDPRDKNLLHEFSGSLNPTAVDDFGQSLFLPDVVAKQTDDVSIAVGTTTAITPTTDFYGNSSATGAPNLRVSPVMLYFTEGGTGYDVTDYATAASRLKATRYDYGYIASGGNQSPAFLAAMLQLAYDTNRQLRFDVSGALTPAAAITFVDSLNADTHYAAAFWAPLLSDDMLNGPQTVLGTSGYNIARACQRNAQTNAKGFAPKNYPIAGKNWPLDRTGIRQIYNPTENELSDLAAAKINPVIYEKYNGGGRFVFTDSLTLAKTQVSLRKLVSTADMASTIDDWVTQFGKEVLQLPMEVAIKKMEDFLKFLFEGAEASGWIIPSAYMDGKAFQYKAQRNAFRPNDRLDVGYALHYDGVARQIIVQQTISR